MEAGLLISNFPVPMTKDASVLPMPVANCPNAPALHVCESVPNNTLSGREKAQTHQDLPNFGGIRRHKSDASPKMNGNWRWVC